MASARPLPIGLQLHSQPLPSSSPSPSPSSTFLPHIMHTPSPPSPFLATVSYSLPLSEIAQALSLPLHTLRTTPLHPSQPHIHPPLPSPLAGLDHGTYADLLGYSEVDEMEIRRFGRELEKRLDGIRIDHIGHIGGNGDVGKREVNGSDSKIDCGFGHVHQDICVMCERKGICKKGNGLYRVAKSRAMLDMENAYFEIVVVEDMGKGGVCVGVVTEQMNVGKMVGMEKGCVGLHSSGMVVRDGVYEKGGRGFGKGQRVGCRIGRHMGERIVEWWVEDEWVGKRCIEDCQDLNGAVSLYVKGSKVVLLCCRNEWKTIRGKSICSRN